MTRWLLRSLFVFDSRPAAEVEDDIRAEFDTHLGMLEAELLGQGLDPATAKQQAQTRFGDPRKHSREGSKIKLGDRIMLQRVNLALLVLLGGAVIFLLVQNQRINSRSVETLEQLNASLAAMPTRAAVPGASAKAVYIDGLIQKPGEYAVPIKGLTVAQLVAPRRSKSSAAQTRKRTPS